MPTYDDLRRVWIEALSRTGELEILSADQRRILERGSLVILGVSRTRELRRGQALLWSTLALSLGAVLLAIAAWLVPMPEVTPAAAPSALLAFAALALFAQVQLARRIVRKRELYSGLTARVLAYTAD